MVSTKTALEELNFSYTSSCMAMKKYTALTINRKFKIAALVVCLILVSILIFNYTLGLRKPWLGSLYSAHHINLTAFTLNIARNWYHEGAIQLKFASVKDPISVDADSDIRKRGLYVSWPTGYIVPIHLISKVMMREPTAKIIMKYNLINHFLISIILSQIVLFSLIKIDYPYFAAFIFSCVPILIELLMPGPLYYHQNTYQAQIAVILPYVSIIFLEILRDFNLSKKIRVIIYLLQCVFFLYGAITAYFTYLIALVIYLKRYLNDEIGSFFLPFFKTSLKFWWPLLLGLALFLFQLAHLGFLDKLLARFVHRSVLSSGEEIFLHSFWNGHFINAYGYAGKFAIQLSLFAILCFIIFRLIERAYKYINNAKANQLISIICISLFPCFLEVYLLANHSNHHGYTTLKFSIPLAIVPFSLLPVLLVQLLGDKAKCFLSKIGFHYILINHHFRNLAYVLFSLFFLATAILYTRHEHPRYSQFFREYSKRVHHDKKLEPYLFIRENTSYSDIVFSPCIEISKNRALLAHTMKQVYKIYSLYDIYYKVKSISDDYVINIFVKTDQNHPPFINYLKSMSDTHIHKGNWNLYKIEKDVFLNKSSIQRDKESYNIFRKERKEFDHLKIQISGLLREKNYGPAIHKTNELIAFIERNHVLKYNLRYYFLKIALLEALGKYDEANHLLQALRNVSSVCDDNFLWGWDPEPWILQMPVGEVSQRLS